MKKIRVNFTGSVEIDARDFKLFDMEGERIVLASELIEQGKPIVSKDLIINSMAETITDAIDGEYEDLSWELIEEEV